jgi:hypothetical protein
VAVNVEGHDKTAKLGGSPRFMLTHLAAGLPASSVDPHALDRSRTSASEAHFRIDRPINLAFGSELFPEPQIVVDTAGPLALRPRIAQ